MSSLVSDIDRPSRASTIAADALRVALAFMRIARSLAGWPLRIHANRKILHQMAGMSARELADIGLTPADLRDTAALSPRAEVGQFLASRVGERRIARDGRR